MKAIPVRSGGTFGTLAIIKEASETNPKGMNVAEMRSRIRILDAVEKADGNSEVVLEDADHTTLTEAINSMPWARADRSILQIIDDILTAPTMK